MINETSIAHLLEEAISGNEGALARLLTLAELGEPSFVELVRKFPVHSGNVIGITGPPGVGKSTLVNRLINLLRIPGKRVGVVAVDPSSPLTGGAVLGDRIRMQEHALDQGVFIRSVAARNRLGGLGPGTEIAVALMRLAGLDYVLVETVGVGQNEVDVMRVADTVTVVLSPGNGDSMQLLKSGLMEIADVYVVNKADQSGAKGLAKEILAWRVNKPDWQRPVVLTNGASGEGVNEWLNAIQLHQDYLRCKMPEVSK